MDALAVARTAQRKCARRRTRVDPVYYVVEIQDWDWSFSFGVTKPPLREGPYGDYRHLVVKGKLLRPSKVKTETVELSFLPDQKLNEGRREHDPPPPSIGALSLHRGHLSGVFGLPADALPLLLTMATAGHLRYVILLGAPFRYGHASIKNFRFEMKVEEDDLPGDP